MNSGALDQAKRHINWLLANQQSEGNFPAYPASVNDTSLPPWYSHLETDTYADAIATAYTLIGILEHDTVGAQYAASAAVRSKLLRASAYLKSMYTSTSDIHYLSITAYALQLAGLRLNDRQALSIAGTIVDKLNSLACSHNGKTFWPYNRKQNTCISVLAGEQAATSIEVELASFMLEYHYLNSELADATPIFRFLLSQRGPRHTFPLGTIYSSHTTALGQQAIGDYLLMAKLPASYSGTIKIEAVGGLSPYSETIAVYENTIKPIELALPQGIPELKVTSTAGMTQVSIKTIKYYLNPYHAYTSYHSGVLEIHVFSSPTSEKGDFATIKVCNSWNRNESSGMIVSLVELPSGYALHSTLKDIKQQHPTDDGGSYVGSLESQDDKNFAIYYDKLPHYESMCTEVLLRRTIHVENLATAAVRSYSYYETQFIGFELYKVSEEPQIPKQHQHSEL